MGIKLDDHLCFKLYVASRLVIRGYGDLLAPLNLTYPKYLVLLALGENDGQTVGSLAELLSLDFGTLSPVLKSLEQHGYLLRQRQEQDERSVANFLTAEGRVVLRKAKHVAVQLYEETAMPDVEFAELRSRVDEYVVRCKNIVNGRKQKPRAARGAKSKGKDRESPEI